MPGWKNVRHLHVLVCDMLSKIVLLFLVFIAALGFFGKLHWIGGKRLTQTKCSACGRYRIGNGKCQCGGGR